MLFEWESNFQKNASLQPGDVGISGVECENWTSRKLSMLLLLGVWKIGGCPLTAKAIRNIFPSMQSAYKPFKSFRNLWKPNIAYYWRDLFFKGVEGWSGRGDKAFVAKCYIKSKFELTFESDDVWLVFVSRLPSGWLEHSGLGTERCTDWGS